MHRLKRLACVISGDTLCLDVIKEVLHEVHLWEVPGPLFVRLENGVRFVSITFVRLPNAG